MSVTALKTSYHHGDLRHVLMSTACEHIAREGTEKLSLRALAREAGVSPTAPYRHFPTKSCLLAAIASTGFEELLAKAKEYEVEAGPDPLAQLAAGAKAYVHYAMENPVKFHLMFGTVVADFTAYEDLQKNAAAAFENFGAQVQRAKSAGLLQDVAREEIVAYVWSGMHGMASLIVDKTNRLQAERLSPGMESVRFMRDKLDVMVARFINGIRAEK